MSLTLLALIVAILVALGAFAYAVSKGLQFWHDAKLFLGDFDRTMDDFALRADRLAAREPPDLGRVDESVARLQRSLAELTVLLNAVKRVRDQYAGLLATYPRK